MHSTFLIKAGIVLPVLLMVATASPVTIRQSVTNSSIAWGDCPPVYNGSLPIQCGNITLPIDYTVPNSTTFELQVLKVPATKGPSKGSILFNFGGPGAPAQGRLAARGQLYQTLTGGQYDLISWDPRGTANTLTFSCFQNATIRSLDDLTKKLSVGNASDTSLGRLWSAGAVSAANCATFEQSKTTGPYISTAFTARDMMRIVDATNEDGLLRYYGFSYGTALGATVAAMFPDKIDRVVLDGVVNPSQYYYGYDFDQFADADVIFSQFFQQCLLHPTDCALASHGNVTAASLEAAAYELMDALKYHPLPLEGGLFDYTTFKVQTRAAFYDPALWPLYAQYLNGLLTGNLTQFGEAALGLLQTSPSILTEGTGDDSSWGIQCSDKATRSATFDVFKSAIGEFWNVSRSQGDTTNYVVATCSQWLIEPKERYLGGFEKLKTKNKLLIIGNTYDPATPLRSAVNVTAAFEGSVLLQQNSYGHCTSRQPSLCTAKAIKAYFSNGTLPEAGTVCQPEYHPFSPSQAYDDLLDEIESF